MSSPGGRPKKYEIRPGKIVAGWKVLSVKHNGLGGRVTLECQNCFEQHQRTYEHVAKTMASPGRGFKCSKCFQSTSPRQLPRYGIKVGDIVAGWEVINIKRESVNYKKQFLIRCPMCSNLESRGCSHFYTVASSPKEGFKCSRCAHSTSTHRKSMNLNVGATVWNFEIIAEGYTKTAGGQTVRSVDLKCKGCGDISSMRSAEIGKQYWAKRHKVCSKCEQKLINGEVLGGEWTVLSKGVDTAKRQSWRVKHNACGKVRTMFQKMIDALKAGTEKIPCNGCYRYNYQKENYKLSPHRKLTKWQQQYCDIAIKSRSRMIDGKPVINTKAELNQEIHETELMCSRWDDERCKHEIALLLKKPKFHLEIRQSYEQYRSGDVTI